MNVTILRCQTGARQNRNGKVFRTAKLVVEDKDGARFSVEYWGKDAHEVGVGDEMTGEIIRRGAVQVFKKTVHN